MPKKNCHHCIWMRVTHPAYQPLHCGWLNSNEGKITLRGCFHYFFVRESGQNGHVQTLQITFQILICSEFTEVHSAVWWSAKIVLFPANERWHVSGQTSHFAGCALFWVVTDSGQLGSTRCLDAAWYSHAIKCWLKSNMKLKLESSFQKPTGSSNRGNYFLTFSLQKHQIRGWQFSDKPFCALLVSLRVLSGAGTKIVMEAQWRRLFRKTDENKRNY